MHISMEEVANIKENGLFFDKTNLKILFQFYPMGLFKRIYFTQHD
jgi:hypothetical protein